MFVASALLALACLQGALATNSPGCGKTPSTMTSGTKTIEVNGKAREFIVKLPDGYDANTPHRLVFTFHALGGSAAQIAEGGMGTEAYYGLPPLANGSAVFVSPDGQTAGSVGGLSGWGNVGGEDVLFVDAMVEALEADLCVNQDLRFATGFSYGGAISYAVACARADRFRAVAVLSSGAISGCEDGTGPVAYYHQHGTEDTMLPIDMGREMRDRFVTNNGCTPVSPEPMPDGAISTRVDYEGCAEDYPVSYVVFQGPHTPAAADQGSTTPFGPTNSWKFFSQFE